MSKTAMSDMQEVAHAQRGGRVLARNWHGRGENGYYRELLEE